MSLSYREFIECRYIGLFRISKSISYRTSHIEYLDILKTNVFFVFFRRKFQKFAENSENSPKIRRKFRKFAENSENSLKIRRKFLKKKVFFEALISYRIVSRKKPSYRIDIVSNRKKAYRYWMAVIISCLKMILLWNLLVIISPVLGTTTPAPVKNGMKWLSNVFKESLEQILKETKVNLGSVLRRRVSPKEPSKYFSYLIISSSFSVCLPSVKDSILA